MADDTTNPVKDLLTTVDEPILDSEVNTDSTEQPKEDKFDSKGYSKFVTQTKQEQADLRKLQSFRLRDKSLEEIKEEAPKLVERLKRNKEFADLFEDEIEVSTEEPDTSHDQHLAIMSLSVNGKHLSTGDVKELKKNAQFNKRYIALVNGGYDKYDAAQEAFGLAYPKFAEKAESVLLNDNTVPNVEPEVKVSDAELKFIKGIGARPDKVKEALR